MRKFLQLVVLFASLPLCGGTFGGSGEFLYFAPFLRDNYFAVANKTDTTAHMINIANYKPGWRLNAFYLFNEAPGRLELRYTNFCGGHRRVLSDVSALIGGIGEVTDSTNFRLHSADFVYHHVIPLSCRFEASILAGAQYSWFRYRENVIGIGVFSEETTMTSFFWGIGPQIGLGGAFNLYPGWKLVANTRASFLVSENHLFVKQENSGVSTFQTPDPTWTVLTSFDTKLGVNYDSCFSKFRFNLNVGYEFISYPDSVLRLQFFSALPFDTKSLSFHGPYAQAGLIF